MLVVLTIAYMQIIETKVKKLMKLTKVITMVLRKTFQNGDNDVDN
jgi:hypothetical protein